MIAKMKLTPDTEQVHVSWAPDRPQKTGVAASVQGISKRFNKSRVLEDVSFDVAEGESLVLLGASGSGKTTILRIIAGLEQPDKGKVILHGKDVTDLPARERGVGVIFQAYALFPRMTVEKNIERSIPGNCPADSSNASLLRAHWHTNPRSCFSTSRLAHWMRRRACTSVVKFGHC